MYTKTFQQLQEIDTIMAQLYVHNPELKNSKLGLGYSKMFKNNFKKYFDEFNEAIENARIDNALSDEKTLAILIDPENPRGYKYSKEGLKKVIQDEIRITKEFMDKEYEYTPIVITEVPELNDYQKEILTGVII